MIKLNKEHAEVLDKLISQGYSKEFIVATQSRRAWHGDFVQKLLDLTLEEVCQALYVGYEIAETKEERLLSFYKYYDSDTDHDSGLSYGVLRTLEILNIKIKGINE